MLSLGNKKREHSMSQRIALVLLALALSGCASLNWSRPGTTEAQFYQDRMECEQMGANMYPPRTQQPTGQVQTNCTTYGNQTNCTSRAAPDLSQAIDTSISQRASALESCLRSRGYTRGK